MSSGRVITIGAAGEEREEDSGAGLLSEGASVAFTRRKASSSEDVEGENGVLGEEEVAEEEEGEGLYDTVSDLRAGGAAVTAGGGDEGDEAVIIAAGAIGAAGEGERGGV